MLKGTLNLGAHQASLEYTGSQTKVWTNFAPVPDGALTVKQDMANGQFSQTGTGKKKG